MLTGSYFCSCFLLFSPYFFLRKIKRMTTLLTWDWFIQWCTLEMDACFLKGQEHYHSFRLFVALLYFLASFLQTSTSFSPSVSLVIISEKADGGNKSGRLSLKAFALFFLRPKELSTYSIKLITQAKSVKLALRLTRSKLHLKVFKQP